LQGPEAGLRETFKLADAPELWLIVLVIAPALPALCWLSYRREKLTPSRKAVLASLRFVALAALVAGVVPPRARAAPRGSAPGRGPGAGRRLGQHAPRGHLQRRPARTRRAEGAARQQRAGRSRGARDRQPLELVSAALQRELLPRLEKGKYVPRVFSFASEIAPLSDPADLEGRGPTTQIGGALSQALAAHRGRHVTDAVILSDGRQNSGLAASEAARAAAAIGLAVHTVAVGDTRAERNALVELAEAPSSILEGDEIALAVRVVGAERAAPSAPT
jgi:hypothetical protein